MRFALDGTEKVIVWKAFVFIDSNQQWRAAWGRNGCPLGTPTRFATWREAMDYATGAVSPDA